MSNVPPNPAAFVDVDLLLDTVETALYDRRMSMRQLALECSFSPNVISRLRMDSNAGLSLDTFASLVVWLGVPAETFIVRSDRDRVDA